MKKILTLILTTLCYSQLISSGVRWSTPPITISSDRVKASDPQVAIDSSGNAVAAWVEDGVVKASDLRFGGSWSSPVALSNEAVTASAPRIVLDRAGNATAIWLENTTVKSAVQSFSESWKEVAFAATDLGASSPQLAVDAAGNTVAIWVTTEGTSAIQSATKLFKGAWTASPDTVSSDSIPSDSPQVAIAANGSVVAIWHGVIATVNTIYSATKAIDGTWVLGQAISNSLTNSGYPQVAIDRSGNATAIWYRYNLSGSFYSDVILQSATLPAGGIWTSPIDISLPSFVDPARLISRIALNDKGNAAIVWANSFDGAKITIQSSTKSPNSNSWLEPIGIAEGIYAYSADLSTTAEGQAFAVFMASSSPDTLEVQAIESDINGYVDQFWTPAITLSKGGKEDGYPRVAASLSGDMNNVVAVWIDAMEMYHVIQAATGTGSIVLPPNNPMLRQASHDLNLFTEYFNILTWEDSSDPSVVGYLVFRNGVLINQVFVPGRLEHIDRNRIPNVVDVYGIAAIDDQNNQSKTIAINLASQ